MPIYALGSNGSGQLGIGHDEDVNIATELILPGDASFISKNVQIVGGGNHTLIRVDNRVWAAGDCSRCQYSAIKSEGKEHGFSLIESNIDLCSATWESTNLVTNNGLQAQVQGRGLKGELGLGKHITQTTSSTAEPILLHDLSTPNASVKITDIASSLAHTVAILSNGNVYGWGAGRKGQLGLTNKNQYFPHQIWGIPFKPTSVFCGKDFSYFVGEPESGDHFIVTNSDKGGIMTDMPTRLPAWKQIAVSWGSIFVLLRDGSLLAWGRNDHGQLGSPAEELPRLKTIAAGSEHVIAITDEDRPRVISWGWGEHGNCGVELDEDKDVKGRFNDLCLPAEDRGEPIAVGAGCATSFIVTSSTDAAQERETRLL